MLGGVGGLGMKYILSIFMVWVFQGGLFAQNADIPASGKGTFELRWEPKMCITTPCPQFAVVKFNDKKIEGIGADIDRKDFEKSAMSNFKTFFVKGTYDRDAEHPEAINIHVLKWFGIVKEDFSPAPSKR
jgi:hypothetical protein